MKKILGALIALFASAAFSATTVPVQLINPTGSTTGQAIVSTGSSSAPTWGNVTATTLSPQAANTVVANATASTASPIAVAMPSCSTVNSALQYTSGTGFGCFTNSATLAANTFTGAQTVNGSSSPQVVVNDTSGTGTPRFIWNNNGTNVWALVTQNNSSGTLALFRYVSGVNTDQPISVSNSTGAVTMADGITGSPISGSTGSFTTLSASSTVSGTGFSSYLAAPPAIGGTTPAAGSFTTLSATGAITPSQTAGIVGTTTNNSANAGSVGEVICSLVTSGGSPSGCNTNSSTPVSLTTATATNVASISLSAGQWDVCGTVEFLPAASTTVVQVVDWIGTVSASLPSIVSPSSPFSQLTATLTTGQAQSLSAGCGFLKLAGTTTVYLGAQSSFSVSTMTAIGFIMATRRR
jgi:hypothetical protein